MNSHHNSMHDTSHVAKIIGPWELLKVSLRFFRDHWKTLVPIVVIPSLITFVAKVLLYANDSFFIKLISVLLSIGSVILSILMIPALLTTIDNIKIGHRATLPLTETYKRSVRFFWWFILIGLMNSLIGLGSVVLFIIPVIIVSIYGCFYIYTFVLEGKKGFAAFTESYSLVYQRWWGVLGRTAFIILASIVFFSVFGFLFGLLLEVLGIGGSSIGYMTRENILLFNIFSNFFNIILIGVYFPIFFAYTYHLYLALKAHRVHPVHTETFKKWIIAFLIIGILAIPTIIGGSIVAASIFKDKLLPFLTRGTFMQQEVEKSIEKALMEENTPESRQILENIRKFNSSMKAVDSNTSESYR